MTRWMPLLVLLPLLVGHCSDRVRVLRDPGGIGERCEDIEECREGLICRDNFTCGPAGTTAEGEACDFWDDCEEGLACLWERNDEGVPQTVCRAAGTGDVDDWCASTADCQAGLVCVAEGFGGRCRRGAEIGDIGDGCETLDDCHAGLVCGRYGECVRATSPDGGPGFPVWEGVECADSDLDGPTRFHFEVPRGPLEPGHDFFRLPWPNDIRRTADGHLDLSGFPHPEMPGFTVDVLDRFLRAAEEDLTGYGTNSAVFFRSNRAIDWSTLDGNGDAATIYFIDLTPPAEPTDPHGRLGFGWGASTGGGPYICQHWLGVKPPRGGPLLPGRTYAVVLTAGVRDVDGNRMARDPDFEQLLNPSRPGDDALGSAWDAYAPFRAYLDRDGVDPGSILVAAVFTTQDFPELLAGAKAVVAAAPAPVPTGLIRCDAAAHSLCDDGLTGAEHVRGCFGEDPAFDELQGAFPSPRLQQGAPPYWEESQGGGFTLGSDGLPETYGETDVCFALTVPKDVPMPAEGWPVVLMTHGTGGDYRGFIRSGIAADLSAVALDDGSTVNFAVLSFDEPQHGRRRGGSTESSEVLFFNFMNPRAAYGNVLQGVVDGFQAARLLGALDLDAATSPTGAAVSFDPTRVFYYGHSQGATHGVPTVAYDPTFVAAVFSGNGGSLIDSLLTKTSPYPIAGAVRMALADPDIGGFHPALSVFQTYLEVADPVNYGRYVISAPFADPTGAPYLPRSVLQLYGLGDTYTPKETQAAMGVALGLLVAEPVIEDLGFTPTTLPASANRWAAGHEVTAVLSQHNPAAGQDGHFVATEDAVARERVSQFFGTAVRDGIPTVVR
jgi:predicted esterase